MQLGSRRALVGATSLALNTAEGGTDGVAVTTGNSGGTSGNAWDAVAGSSNGSSIKYSATQKYSGALSYQFNNGTIQGSSTYVAWSPPTVGSRTKIGGRAFVWIPSRMTASFYLDIIGWWQAGVQFNGYIRVNDDGTRTRLVVGDHNDVLALGSVAVNIASWFRVDFYIVTATAGGKIQAQLFNTPGSVNPDETVLLAASTTNTGTVTDQAFWGPFGNQAGTGTPYTSYMDNMQLWIPA